MRIILSLFLLCAGASAVLADFECKSIPGKLRQIDAGAGKVYGVNDIGNIYSWVNNSMKQVPGTLSHVSVGRSGVWGVNKQHSVFTLEKNKWKSVLGSMNQVDAGGDMYLVGVNSQDNIFCLMENCTISRSSLVTWTHIEGSLKYSSCGGHSCWGINNDENIFFRNNVNPTTCQGSKWQQVEGSLSKLEVGTDGSVYGVNSVGDAFRREGITAKTPTGTSWTSLDFCVIIRHITYDDGSLWLLSEHADIFRCKEVK